MGRRRDKRATPYQSRGRTEAASVADAVVATNQANSQLTEAFQRLCGGDHEFARMAACDVLSRDPKNGDAWHLIGMTFHCAGNHSTALEAVDKACQLDRSANATIACTRGSILAAMGRYDEAIASYRLALHRQPSLAEAHRNLGTCHLAIHENEQAVVTLQECVRIAPEFGRAWSTLSTARLRIGLNAAAVEAAKMGVDLSPDDPVTCLNYGIALLAEQRIDEAFAILQHALHLDPRSGPAYHNMGHALLASGRVSEAVICFRAAKDLNPALASDYLFTVSHDPTVSEEFVRHEHAAWGESLAHLAPQVPHVLTSAAGRKLRIGYVSPDFRHHVMANYLLPIFEEHDRQRFELFAYAEVSQPDATTERFRQLADHWRPTVGVDDERLAQLVRDDRIDILVDLAGHTAHNRLSMFARKPAPIQVTWLGYSNSTGLKAIDYRITNEFQDPRTKSAGHVERLWYVPSEGVCFRFPESGPEVAELPALRRGTITFGSLHRLNKLSKPTLDLWCDVIKSVPNSRLLLFWPTLHGERRAQIESEITARGIAPERLELRHEAGPTGYLSQYHDIDIGLDPTHWTGSTTTREALYMGVCVVAYCGARRSARGSATVLHYAGLESLIARSPEQYVALATELASQPDRLAALRRTMRSRLAATIGDTTTQLRQIESAYQSMWLTACQTRQTLRPTTVAPEAEIDTAFQPHFDGPFDAKLPPTAVDAIV